MSSTKSGNKCWLLPAPTIKQVTKVQDLEELSLPHEALQRAGPAFSKNLDPLKVQLEANVISRETQQIRVRLCFHKKEHVGPVIYLKRLLRLRHLHSPNSGKYFIVPTLELK